MKVRLIITTLLVAMTCSCTRHSNENQNSIPIISWGGIAADKADTLYSLAKECGFNMHLGLYRAEESALASMDAAARKGIGVIISFPQIKDSTETAIALIKDHPALFGYHLKDEPDTSDFDWLGVLSDRIRELDSVHPCYINLLPNWSWGVEEYLEKIESFASQVDVPFYSFDNYPVVEKDGVVTVRPHWYRNLEEFSAMARRHDKPFWGFVLAKAHSISWPEVAVYPEPTLAQLRLQAFSNLLYGAQAIQYFNFTGIVDPRTCEKLPVYDLVRQVNSEIHTYSSVFAGGSVIDIWHTGDSIPAGTKQLMTMPHKKVKSLEFSTGGGVISLIENNGHTYLAIQNRSCTESAILNISFNGRVLLITVDGTVRFDRQPIMLEPGNIAVFQF